MPPFETWERILGFVIATLSALLAISLWIQGLARTYPIFTIFLTFGALRSFFVAIVQLAGNTYAYFFIVTELIQMVLYFLMVLELYGLVFRQFQGIRVMSRLTVSATLALSVCLSAASLWPEVTASEKGRQESVAKQKKEAEDKRIPDAKSAPEAEPKKRLPPPKNSRLLLDLFLISERGVLSALVLMILGMSLFLAWFPIELPSNVLLHCILFAAYFLSKAAMILYRNIGRSQVAEEWRSIVMVGGIVCLIVWIIGMRRRGEATTRNLAPHLWNRENEGRLVQQLKGINAALGRLARE